jgi:hypothetical protein
VLYVRRRCIHQFFFVVSTSFVKIASLNGELHILFVCKSLICITSWLIFTLCTWVVLLRQKLLVFFIGLLFYLQP